MTAQYLVILFALLFLSNCDIPDQVIKTDEKPYSLSPDDAFYKFDNLTETDIINHFNNFIDTNHIKLKQEDYNGLIDWIENKVFSHHRDSHFTVEWNINDEDFCKTITTRTMTHNNELKSKSTINICNSLLNKNISGGGFWSYYIKGIGRFYLTHHCKATKYHGERGYYEILKKEDQLELSDITSVGKYSAIIQTYLFYEDERLKVTKKISTASGYLYTWYKAISIEE